MHAGTVRAISWVGPVLAAALAVSCFSPNLGGAPFLCGADGRCPSGYVCDLTSMVCVAEGAVQDGGVTPVPDGGPTPDIIMVGTESCPQLVQCAGTCEGAGCVDSCRVRGTAQAQALFDALSACLAGPCGDACGAGGAGCGECASTTCGSQLSACQMDTSGQMPDGGTSDLPRFRPLDGGDDAPARDQGPGPDGPAEDGPPPADMTQTDGPPPVDMTVPPPDMPLPTNLSCNQLLGCVGACGDDDACGQDCYNRGTPDARARYDAAADCVFFASLDACFFECVIPSPICDACVFDECSVEITDCESN